MCPLAELLGHKQSVLVKPRVEKWVIRKDRKHKVKFSLSFFVLYFTVVWVTEKQFTRENIYFSPSFHVAVHNREISLAGT